MRFGKKSIVTLAMIGALSVGTTALGNQEDRRAAMKAIGAASKAISEGTDVAANAAIIAEKAGMIPELFATEEITGDSTALPIIWEKSDDFNAIGAKLVDAANIVADVAGGGGDVAAAGKAMGAVCGECHGDYRVKR